jgi:thiamine biosynthesis lipoprotein
MRTRFEIVLHGSDPVALRAAGEQALDAIEGVEAQLSLYRPSSEIARVNRHAATAPVQVSPPVYDLLRRAADLSRATGGAFDPTIAPLVRCWGFMDEGGRWPDRAVLDAARHRVGWKHLILDPDARTVRFARPGMMLDLGAIGKGHALDLAVDLLREAGVTSAFLHGGTSSCYALGRPPDAPAWKAAIADPRPKVRAALWAEIALEDASLGVSAPWTKFFLAGARTCGHVLDPRTGEPVQGALLAAVVLPSAADTDALSTALLVLGQAGLSRIRRIWPEARLLWAEPGGDGDTVRLHRRGIAPPPVPDPAPGLPALPPISKLGP